MNLQIPGLVIVIRYVGILVEDEVKLIGMGQRNGAIKVYDEVMTSEPSEELSFGAQIICL